MDHSQPTKPASDSVGSELPGPDFTHAVYTALAFFGVGFVVLGVTYLAKLGLAQFGIRAAFLTRAEIYQLAAGIIVLFGAMRLSRSSWRDVVPMAKFSKISLVPVVTLCWGVNVLVVESTHRAFGSGQLGGPAELRESMNPIFLPGLLIVAPVVEELLFRGWMLRGFRARYSTRAAILMSAFLFSMLHWGPAQMINAFLTGVLMAWLVMATGSIVPAIVAHVAVNSTAPLLYLLFRQSYSDSELSSMQSLPSPLLVASAIACIVSLCALWALFRQGRIPF